MHCSRRLATLVTVLPVLAVGATTAAAAPPSKDSTVRIDVSLAAPEAVTQGAQFEYVAVVSAGRSALEDVRLTDTLPTSLRYAAVSADRGSCSVSGSTVTCELGTLLRREQATVRIQVVADAAGSVTNTVAVTGTSSGKSAAGSATATTEVTAPPPPDPAALRMEFARDAAPATVGAPLTYRARITNDGPATPLTVVFGSDDNWTLSYPVVQSFTATQGTCTNAPAMRYDFFGYPIRTPLDRTPQCSVTLDTGQAVELVGVVRTNHPTTESLPLYVGIAATPDGVTWPLHMIDEVAVSTGAALTDCALTETGYFTNVDGYLACATRPQGPQSQ